MSVFQISKIQIRRGQKNETGIPQLASGEMAWAIDTQELYIGNGAVSEGAPYVGNTRVLTEHDSLLTLAEQYQYQPYSGFQTGVEPNSPVYRSIQSRLDDSVNSNTFGISTSDTPEVTAEKIQNAIDQLFPVNTNDQISVIEQNRVVFEFMPGIYTFSSTIQLPSHVTIIGAGKDKTIFRYTGTGTAFEFINNAGSNDINTTTYSNQPQNCYLKGFSIETANENDNNVVALKLNAVRDSHFEDIDIIRYLTGNSPSEYAGIGIVMYARSAVVTCEKNTFRDVTFKRFQYGVYSDDDIQLNGFYELGFYDVDYGVAFGLSLSQNYGPRNNIIQNSIFQDVAKSGIIVERGYGNRSKGNTFINVGNDGGAVTEGIYGQIKFGAPGNNSVSDSFDRSFSLSSNNWVNNEDENIPYVSEVEGTSYFRSFVANRLNLIYAVDSVTPRPKAFRLPVDVSCAFEVEYVFSNEDYDQIRRGKMSITVSLFNTDSTPTSSVNVTDEYDFVGDVADEENLKFYYEYVDGQLIVTYSNTNQGTNSFLTYTYTKLS